MTCIDCGRPVPSRAYRSPVDGAPRCPCCARREVLSLLDDADPDSLGKLRRRAEDLLRKDDTTARSVISDLAARGKIKWVDVI